MFVYLLHLLGISLYYSFLFIILVVDKKCSIEW